MLVKHLIRLYKKRYKCSKGLHEWTGSVTLNILTGATIIYTCRNCKEFVPISDSPIQRPHWLDDLSVKVEKALEKNP